MSIYSLVNILMSYWNVFHLFAHTWNNSKLFYCDLCALKCVHTYMCVCEREREGENLSTDAHFIVGAVSPYLPHFNLPALRLLLLGPRNLTFPSFAFFSFLFLSSSLPLSLSFPPSLTPSGSPLFIFLLLLLPSSLFSFYLFYLFTYSTIIYWLFYVLRKYVYCIMNKAEKLGFRQDPREIS